MPLNVLGARDTGMLSRVELHHSLGSAARLVGPATSVVLFDRFAAIALD